LSFETLIWVRTQKTGNPINRSVLRVLADHAGQDASCYLRTQLIADETELSESSIRKALASLIEQGLVRVYERYHLNGARRSNRYQLLVDGAETPPPDHEDWAGVRERTGEGPSGGEAPTADGPGRLRDTEGFPVKEATLFEATPEKGAPLRRTLATRVPDDFKPDEKMREWFRANNLSAVIDGAVEHEKFMDYWRAEAGARARKLDWPATWRRWMRSAAERGQRRPGTALDRVGSDWAAPSGGIYRPSTTDQRIAQGQALAAKYREQGL
jgi:helix-turn-helix protein